MATLPSCPRLRSVRVVVNLEVRQGSTKEYLTTGAKSFEALDLVLSQEGTLPKLCDIILRERIQEHSSYVRPGQSGQNNPWVYDEAVVSKIGQMCTIQDDLPYISERALGGTQERIVEWDEKNSSIVIERRVRWPLV